jgi:GH43 family beta-xylosidase
MEEGSWEFLGQVKGLPDHWNIDATVFTLPATTGSSEKLYCCYSGWPTGDFSDTQQDLFLVELESPEIAKPESVVCISRAELPWERTEDNAHGVNEGASFLSIPGFQGIIYSANGSWTSNYRLAVLELIDSAHPLDPKSWRKKPTPLLVSDHAQGGPYGPGHASFIPSTHGDGRVYCIYHATEFEGQGWDNRKARVLSFRKEHFMEGAETMCCALKVSGTWSGGASVSGSGPHAASGPPQGQQAQLDQGQERRKSLIDKIGDKVMQKLRGFR